MRALSRWMAHRTSQPSQLVVMQHRQRAIRVALPLLEMLRCHRLEVGRAHSGVIVVCEQMEGCCWMLDVGLILVIQ